MVAQLKKNLNKEWKIPFSYLQFTLNWTHMYIEKGLEWQKAKTSMGYRIRWGYNFLIF